MTVSGQVDPALRQLPSPWALTQQTLDVRSHGVEPQTGTPPSV